MKPIYRKEATSNWPCAAICCLFLLAGCGGGGGGGGGGGNPPPVQRTIDDDLNDIIAANALSGDPTTGRNLPTISDPLAQLGKLLFFSKSLSGDFDTACASCHHPALGGGDALSLAIGTGTTDPDVVGPGRARTDDLPNVGRHSQSVFNVGLFDAGLFHDSRIESLGKEAGMNGAGSGIRTPDSPFGVADPAAGSSLPAAQARFPVAVPSEMRGSLLPAADDETVRNHLAARIGDYGSGQGEIANNNWLPEFQAAFNSTDPADQLITFDNIALAIAEYERSMIFVDTPWKSYVEGNAGALTAQQKQGAKLFFQNSPAGAGCAQCHSGDFFTDEMHTTIAFPQIGPGKGDGANLDDDFGREQQTGLATDRFRFRTPTLLNLAVTAPYSHAGVYRTIEDAVNHYAVPQVIFNNFLGRGGVCELPQFGARADCATLYPNIGSYFDAALMKVLDEQANDPDGTFPDISNLQQSDFPMIRAFLMTLTDPCVSDRTCLAPWVPGAAEAPDDHQLNAVDRNGAAL